MADFGSRLCGNPERSATPFYRSKTTFPIHAIIPITIFDFLARCFLENRSLDWRRINKMSTPNSTVVFVLCQSVPHLALRVLLLSPRERIEVWENTLNK